MAKNEEVLFEESTKGSVSAITAFAFVLSFALLLAAAVLTSYGASWPNPHPLVFVAGACCGILAFAIPFGILPLFSGANRR